MNVQAEPPLPAARPKSARPARKKILLVDDDPAIRHILLRVLSEENYFVLTAADGVEALELAEEARFDLVLLDLNMPIKDGWETFDQLRARHPRLPVIVITARPNQLFTAMSAGVGALIEKPLDFTRLFRTITHLLSEPTEEQDARSVGKMTAFEYHSANPSRLPRTRQA